MTDVITRMSDAEIAAQITAHREALEALRKLQLTRAQAKPAAPVTIAVCEASGLSGMSESQIRRAWAANPYDQGGFGIRTGGRWRVEKYRYLEYLDARLRVSHKASRASTG